MKTIIQSGFVLLTFVCLAAVGPTMQAVVPAPDGGYPGGNTAEGQNALFGLTSGGYNTAVGWLSLKTDATGSFNTAIGAGALLANTADQNTATGAGALFSNTFGALNTAVGALALRSNTAGTQNTAVGDVALGVNTTGDFNTAIGTGALYASTGSSNIALGNNAGSLVTTAGGVICIGTSGRDVHNSCFIGHIRGVTTAVADAIPVYIDSHNQLGTVSSSRRFKKEIKPIDSASEAVLALRPVTFHYKNDESNRPQFGLIAEEIAEVNPDLVVRDENGEIYTVRYDAVNAMLLNEFLKQHRRVEEQNGKLESQGRKIQQQETTIAELKSGMKALTATVNEQASQLRRVTARLQMANPAMRVVAENP